MGPIAYNPFNPYYMQFDFRDWFGLPDGPCIRSLEFLQISGCCYVPRLYRAPDVSVETFDPDAYVSTVVTLPAASWILGFKNNAAMPPFMFQVTDLGLNRTLFSQPVYSGVFGQIDTPPQTPDQLMPSFFTSPYPVVKPGNFEVEIWRVGGTSPAIINLCLFAAELQL